MGSFDDCKVESLDERVNSYAGLPCHSSIDLVAQDYTTIGPAKNANLLRNKPTCSKGI